ncbi:MAG: rhomboid family intramembrane serine protease [Acidimicrobiales bacterium]|nr:rhomboid family intramembrane serine protease [Acidimicrobiales bacterium]
MTLIGLNVAVFLAQILSGGDNTGVRGAIADKGLLIGYGITRRFDEIGVAAGEWWRLVTSGFLHAGIFHLGMNMLALWILGSQLEPVLGRARFFMLYLTSLLGGSFAVMLISPTDPTVGASGAIFGLFGVAFVFQRSRGIDPWRSGVAGLILVNLLFTFTVPGISIGGHVGGLVGGALAAYAVIEIDKRSSSVVPAVAACALLSACFVFGAIWAAISYAHPLLRF